jgi:hypothetical protein
MATVNNPQEDLPCERCGQQTPEKDISLVEDLSTEGVDIKLLCPQCCLALYGLY